MRQRSDDAGRNLRGVWLGPEGAIRWWFDATYKEWLVGGAAFFPAFIVFWLVLPLGVLVFVWCAWFARFLARYASWKRFSATTNYRAYYGLTLVFCVAVAPYPMVWLLPLPWWVAAPSAVAASVFIVRAARPYLDGNRPISYWITTLQNIASGPRPLRPIAEITPEGFMIIDGHDTELGDDLWRFMLAVNNADPEEVTVRRYRQRSPEVEAVLWDIGSGDEKTGHLIIAWLRQRGHEVTVSNVVYTSTPGKGNHPKSADVTLDGAPLPQRCVIFFHQANPMMWGTRPVEEFAVEFEEVSLEIASDS